MILASLRLNMIFRKINLNNRLVNLPALVNSLVACFASKPSSYRFLTFFLIMSVPFHATKICDQLFFLIFAFFAYS